MAVTLYRQVGKGKARRYQPLLTSKGKDAESEEAQEHANTSSLALYA